MGSNINISEDFLKLVNGNKTTFSDQNNKMKTAFQNFFKRKLNFDLFKGCYDHSKFGVLLLDDFNRIQFINDFGIRALALEFNNYSQMNITDVLGKSNLSKITAYKPNAFIFYNSNYTYNVYEFECHTVKTMWSDYRSITFTNITSQYEMEKNLSGLKSKYINFLDNIPDTLLCLDSKGNIKDYIIGKNNAIPMIPHQLIHKNIFELLPIDTANLVKFYIDQTLKSNKTHTFECAVKMNKTEKYFEVKVYIANNSQVICLARDISERKLALNRLQFINIHDPLTGLYNRSYFEQKLVEFDSQAFLPLGIVICDLDWLKLVNDAFGHYYGDELLKASAKIIQSSLTSMEIPCRIGGDEFAVLFPNCSQALLEKFNDRINQEIETYNYTNPKLPISFSMGSCIRMDMQTTINAVYKNADNLMYHEKLVKGYNHRNQFVQIIIKNLDNKNHLSGHLKDQIQTYVLKLANAIEYPKKQMPNIKLFIEFHDIGYISIPDEILNKKSPLKEDEWNSIKKHSEVGYKLSLSIPDLLPVADWVLKHHEWWNGQGYPLGLEGNSIPIECRMLSIVKAYLAMTHDRPYRKAMTVEEAVNELERCAGVQFDPILVDVFKNILYEEDITNEQLTIDTLTHETPTA